MGPELRRGEERVGLEVFFMCGESRRRFVHEE